MMSTVQDKLDAIELLSGYIAGSTCLVSNWETGCIYEYLRNDVKKLAFYGYTYDDTENIEY